MSVSTPSAQRHSLARGFLTFGSLTLVSRIVGFVRDMLTAAYLGAGPLNDAFVVAQRLPNLFRTLFAEGAVSAAFVPAFKRVQHAEGLPQAQLFAEHVQAWIASILLPFTGLMMIAMPWVIRLIAPGFADEPLRFTLAVTLGLITFPYLPLITLTALQGSALNAIGRNGPYAAAPILFNIVQVVGLVVFAPLTQMPAHVLAWGMTAAGAVQFAFLAWFCRRYDLPLRWRLPRITPEVRAFFRKLLPGVIGGSATQLNLVASTILASLLPVGAVSYLYYADRLNQLPLGVVGIALYTTTLPLFAQHQNTGNTAALRSSTSRAVDLALLFGLPAAGGLCAVGTQIMAVLFVRGAFTLPDAFATGEVLDAYALGIPAFMLVRIVAARFQAAGDTTTPARSGVVAVAANIAFAVWLLRPLGAVGIALATSLASMLNLTLLSFRLRQRSRRDGMGDVLDPLTKRRAWRVMLATGAMMLASWGVGNLLADQLYSGTLPVKLVSLSALLGCAVLVYAAMLWMTGAVDRSTLRLLKRG